jgi:uncharacterized membrane protein
MTTNYSRARIAGHPIHPMLVAFPITFYTSTLVGFIVYAVTGNVFWWSVALWANFAGVIMAIVAALPGFIDWATGIPRKTAAKRDGAIHMALNVTVLLLFIINLIVQGSPWVYPTATTTLPDPLWGILLSGTGVLLTLVAGALGWRLVQTHHVGIVLDERGIPLPGRATELERESPVIAGRAITQS